MLRRPCVYSATQLGEGCSSTAFGTSIFIGKAVWANPTSRGSASPMKIDVPALP
jgi:hypothetical protein